MKMGSYSQVSIVSSTRLRFQVRVRVREGIRSRTAASMVMEGKTIISANNSRNSRKNDNNNGSDRIRPLGARVPHWPNLISRNTRTKTLAFLASYFLSFFLFFAPVPLCLLTGSSQPFSGAGPRPTLSSFSFFTFPAATSPSSVAIIIIYFIFSAPGRPHATPHTTILEFKHYLDTFKPRTRGRGQGRRNYYTRLNATASHPSWNMRK